MAQHSVVRLRPIRMKPDPLVQEFNIARGRDWDQATERCGSCVAWDVGYCVVRKTKTKASGGCVFHIKK